MTRAHVPTSLTEAIHVLGSEPALVLMAGCTDLMVSDPEARAAVPGVLDLSRIPEIRGIREVDGELEIGSGITFGELGRHPHVRETFPALAQAAEEIGGWQIQTRATLGGNVANASPAGDSLPVLLVLDATVVAVGPSGERRIPYDRFHRGYRRTALRQGELIAWIRLPAPPEGAIQGFRKVGTRRAQAISKVVVSMLGTVEDRRITAYRLAAGSVAPTPVRLVQTERRVVGRTADRETADRAGRWAAAEVHPIDDVRSTAAYRSFALERVTRRLTLALSEH